jgi:hypothetical protein
MIALVTIFLLLSGTTFLSTFTFIMYCRRLGIDPNLLVPIKDIDVYFTCKLSAIVTIIELCILHEMIIAHPLVHLGLN